jgi:hypothetical protein
MVVNLKQEGVRAFAAVATLALMAVSSCTSIPEDDSEVSASLEPLAPSETNPDIPFVGLDKMFDILIDLSPLVENAIGVEPGSLPATRTPGLQEGLETTPSRCSQFAEFISSESVFSNSGEEFLQVYTLSDTTVNLQAGRLNQADTSELATIVSDCQVFRSVRPSAAVVNGQQENDSYDSVLVDIQQLDDGQVIFEFLTNARLQFVDENGDCVFQEDRCMVNVWFGDRIYVASEGENGLAVIARQAAFEEIDENHFEWETTDLLFKQLASGFKESLVVN